MLAAPGMIPAAHCLVQIHAHAPLHEYGLAQGLHSSLQRLQPEIEILSDLVKQRSHLQPDMVLSHVWHVYLQTLARDGVPATQV